MTIDWLTALFAMIDQKKTIFMNIQIAEYYLIALPIVIVTQ